MQKPLLTTRLFTVEQRAYTNPSGDPIHRDVVVHPGAVVILPLLADGRIVMIRNFRYSVGQELWELPAGTIEPSEAPIHTAGRELVEETGYRAAKMTPLMEFYTSPGICTELMQAFVATDLTHVGQDLQGGEQIEVELIQAGDAKRRLLAGEFRDGKTIAVLGHFFLASMNQTG